MSETRYGTLHICDEQLAVVEKALARAEAELKKHAAALAAYNAYASGKTKRKAKYVSTWEVGGFERDEVRPLRSLRDHMLHVLDHMTTPRMAPDCWWCGYEQRTHTEELARGAYYADRHREWAGCVMCKIEKATGPTSPTMERADV